MKFSNTLQVSIILTSGICISLFVCPHQIANAQESEVTLDSKNYYSIIRSNSQKTWSVSTLTRMAKLNADAEKGEKFKRFNFLSNFGNNTLACQDVGNEPNKYFDCITDNGGFGFARNSYAFVDLPSRLAIVAVGKNMNTPCDGPANIYVISATKEPPHGPMFPETKNWKRIMEADGTLQLTSDKFGYIFGCFDEWPPSSKYKYMVTSNPTNNLTIYSLMPWASMKKYTIYSKGW